jgi:hypothetical protein
MDNSMIQLFTLAENTPGTQSRRGKENKKFWKELIAYFP